MKNFEMFINSDIGKDIELRYLGKSAEAKEFVDKATLDCVNNPKYKFLNCSGWQDWEFTDANNWIDQYHFVMKKGEPVGYIKWDIHRQHNTVTEQGLYVNEENWGYEVPMVALKKWADHVLLYRKFHKLIVGAHPANAHLFAILQEARKVGLYEVARYTEHHVLTDGLRYDFCKFQLLREDYIRNLERLK